MGLSYTTFESSRTELTPNHKLQSAVNSSAISDPLERFGEKQVVLAGRYHTIYWLAANPYVLSFVNAFFLTVPLEKVLLWQSPPICHKEQW